MYACNEDTDLPARLCTAACAPPRSLARVAHISIMLHALQLLALCSSSHAIHYQRIRNAQHRGQLVELCNELGLTGNAAEIGVWHGGFSRRNLQVWNGSRYYMIDAWAFRGNDTAEGVVSNDKNSRSKKEHDEDYRTARSAVQPWVDSGRAVLVRRFLEAAVLEFPDEFFDFIYIDAGHEYSNVLRDLRLWWPKLAHGGMFAGDDFADRHDTFPSKRPHIGARWGVKSAVTAFALGVRRPFFLTFADLPCTPLASSTRVDSVQWQGNMLHAYTNTTV